MASLDVKVTVWERIEFDSVEQMEDVKAKLQSGELTDSDSVADYLGIGATLLEDTVEFITIEENDYQTTMEILDDNGDMIWNNLEIQ
jgi:hypothetical protein